MVKINDNTQINKNRYSAMNLSVLKLLKNDKIHVTYQTNISSTNNFIVCDGSNEFSCNNGNCIDNQNVCDNIDDCWDYSDETNCRMCLILIV